MHSTRAPAEFAKRLGATQQQLSQRRQPRAPDSQLALRLVTILVHAAPHRIDTNGKLLLAQPFDGAKDVIIAQVEHRVAVALLVASGRQRIKRKRVLLRRGRRLLDQHAKRAGFVGGEEKHAAEFNVGCETRTSTHSMSHSTWRWSGMFWGRWG